MAKDEQFEVLHRLLIQLQAAGALEELMLIGSWCLYFYRFAYDDHAGLPAFRTLDVDFLVPDPKGVKREVDIPEILRKEGFIPQFNRSSGVVKYNHPELQVEFLVPELGRSSHGSQEVKRLHVKAQGLRYLHLLLDYPMHVSYKELKICAPEPAAFALHKLIVSSRRLNVSKKKSDLETTIGLLNFLCDRPKDLNKIRLILNAIPKKWADTIFSVSRVHYPKLNEMFQHGKD